MSKKPTAKITGLGRNLPPRMLTNTDLEKMVDTTDEWIVSRTGIRERRIADDNVIASELGIPSANEALEKAGVAPGELDLIICATSTPDNMFPSTACAIQHGIGAGECPAFDLLAACSGFIYGATVADQFISAGTAKNVLLVASELYSKIINWEDRATCVLFGDGSASAVFTQSDGSSGMIDSMIRSDGSYGSMLTAGAISARKQRASGSSEAETPPGYFLEMKGNQTFKIAVKKMSDICLELLETNGFTPGDVDIVIPHQANIRILNAVGKMLGIPGDKIFVNLDKYGNTSAASIPIALYEAEQSGRLKPGSLALMVAFGGGLTWGGALVRW